MFSVLRIEDPLARQDYLGPFTFPHLTLPTPSEDCGKQGTVQTIALAHGADPWLETTGLMRANGIGKGQSMPL